MPVYEFVCLACEHRFDRLLAMADPDPACPSCGQARARRQLSVFATSAGDGTASFAGGCGCGGACACGH